MTTTDLVTTSTTDVAKTSREIESTVLRLVSERDHGLLDDSRLRAEAAGLYSKRSGQLEMEQYFMRLRLITEAGIGVLSFDSPEIEATPAWQTYGIALERGRLVELMEEITADGTPLTPLGLRLAIVRAGLTHVPGKSLGQAKKHLRWKTARRVALEQGNHDLKSLPVDMSWAKLYQTKKLSREMLMKESREAAARRFRRTLEEDAKKAKQVKLRTINDSVSRAYGFLRQAESALDEALNGENVDVELRRLLKDIFDHFYKAEDCFGLALRLGGASKAENALRRPA